ncbi:MAG: endonuclease [Acholeplasmataceae bacterium]|nr:endonuclease [Acholeplasmataceae bacterium]
MKFIKLMLVMLIMIGLVGCKKDVLSFDDIEEKLILSFGEGDDIDHIRQDINLPDISIEHVEIEWLSDSQYAVIDDKIINISRPTDHDVEVTIQAKITYQDETKTYDFFITILKEEDIALDLISPTIHGTKDIYVTVGETYDYLYGVTVTDNVDQNPSLVIDDSEVDLNLVGSYSLYYIALDESENETVIEVIVHVEEDILTFYTETFDNLPETGSSYTSGSFVGVNGITWTYQGMRSDQTLDGKAITFGKETSDYLKATIPGGISKLTIDFHHVFSGSSVRVIDLYLNQVNVHTFEIDESNETYEVSDLNLIGEIDFELRNTSGERVIVDNITIFHGEVSQDLKDIEMDIKNLSFPSHIMYDETLQLLTSGQKGSSITYQFNNNNNSHNSYINLSTGEVTVPVDAIVSVDILITFTKGEEQKQIIKTLKLGEGEPLLVGDIYQQSGLVKTEGILTGYIQEDQYVRGFIQDQSGAIQVRFSLDNLDMLEIGYVYIIKGQVTKESYTYLNQVEILLKNDKETITAINLKPNEIDTQQSRYVELSGFLYRDYVANEAMVVVDGELIYVDIHDQINPFIDQKLGQEVSLLGHVVYDNNRYEIMVLDNQWVEVEPFHANTLENYILDALDLEQDMHVQTHITLPSVDPIFGLGISWVSSHPSIVSETGLVSAPDNDTQVTLSYTMKFGSSTILIGELVIHVDKKSDFTGYYADLSGKTGDDLLDMLVVVISRNYKSISYSSTNAVLEEADEHPSGSGYLGVYDHIKITSYNKEHVWPQSSFNEASPYRSDMHHLRISIVNTNSKRSNYYFNNPTSPTSSWQVGSSRFFPGDQDKGDIARMLMYMAVRYRDDNFKLIVAESGRTSNPPARTMGNLAVLYQWHLDDPVDDFERNRNEVIYGTQKNRNPFIDHPEIFEDIWDIFMEEDQERSINYKYDFTQLNISHTDLENIYEVIAIIPKHEDLTKRYQL